MKIYKDLSNQLDPNCYTVGRDGNQVLMLVCHSTAGPNDFNGTSATTAQALSDTSARYLAGNDRQASVQWLVGAENCGAPIYRIVPESDTAYHAGGDPPQYPSSWKDPTTGKVYGGFGLNEVSIGIELFGQTTDVIGPNQKASLQALVKDIVLRYPILLDPMRIVAHKELEGDRTDGMNWRDLARGWVKEMSQPDITDPNSGATSWHCLATDKWVTDDQGFLTYWRNNGGMNDFGYPISGAAYDNRYKDAKGNALIVQWFERARFEYHPENDNPYKVLLGLVGKELLAKL